MREQVWHCSTCGKQIIPVEGVTAILWNEYWYCAACCKIKEWIDGKPIMDWPSPGRLIPGTLSGLTLEDELATAKAKISQYEADFRELRRWQSEKLKAARGTGSGGPVGCELGEMDAYSAMGDKFDMLESMGGDVSHLVPQLSVRDEIDKRFIAAGHKPEDRSCDHSAYAALAEPRPRQCPKCGTSMWDAGD